MSSKIQTAKEREHSRYEEGLALLVEASAVLAGSLDYQATLMHVSRLAVPALADICVVDILETDGLLQRVAVAPNDPQTSALAERLLGQHTPARDEQSAIWRVLLAGQALMLPEIPTASNAGSFENAGHPRNMSTVGPLSSAIVLPLVARGQTLGVLSFGRLIGGRPYSPSDLQIAQEIAQRAALAVDNARLYRDSQAAIQVRDAFLSIASHELKTPLTSLMGYVHILQRMTGQEPGAAEQTQRALGIISRQADRLNVLIEEMLDLSRIQQGRFIVTRQPLDLCAFAGQVVEDLKLALPRHMIKLTCPNQQLIVLGDELRLEQVLQNLLGNAAKYSPAGASIDIRLEQRDSKALMSVSDGGIGIPSAAHDHLFEPFYRASNVGSQSSGFGIGLFIVNEIVKRHGGTVEVYSVEGQGSTFTVILPLTETSEG